jgi:MFS family permease
VFLIEIYSGIIWAGFNLAAGNFIYDAVTKERLAICSSYFNVLSGFGNLIGALIGAFLASHDWGVFGLKPLIFLFVIGGIIRLAVHIFMIRKIKEVREVAPFDIKEHIIVEIKIIFFRCIIYW